jgi:hypothetical protein
VKIVVLVALLVPELLKNKNKTIQNEPKKVKKMRITKKKKHKAKKKKKNERNIKKKKKDMKKVGETNIKILKWKENSNRRYFVYILSLLPFYALNLPPLI